MFKKALSIDVSIAIGHSSLGYAYLLKREYEKALSEVEQELVFNPNLNMALVQFSLVLAYMGRGEEAVEVMKKAIRLDPLPPNASLYTLGLAYCVSGQYEEALSAYKRAIDASPNYFGAHLGVAACYSLLNREKEAHVAAAEVLRLQPNFSLDSYTKKLPYKNPADRDLFVNALRKAGLK